MKLKIVFILCTICAFQYAICQDYDIVADADLYMKNRDTVRVKAFYIHQYNLQFGITTADSSGQEGTTYTPKEIDGFCIYLHNKRLVFTSKSNPNDMGRLFLRVIYEGRVSVYQYLEVDQMKSLLTFVTLYYVWDDDWKKPPISLAHERETLLRHFSDCPDLEYKIKKGEYGITQMIKILKEYETCRLTDEYEFFLE